MRLDERRSKVVTHLAQLLTRAFRPIAFGMVACVDFVERMLAPSGSLYKVPLVPGFERLRWRVGVWRAWRSFGIDVDRSTVSI
jgi:hypothetical protein